MDVKEIDAEKGGQWTIRRCHAKNFWIMCLLILPSCTGSQTKTVDTDFYSALCPRPVASFQRDFTEADQAFFRFLRACSPTESVEMTDFKSMNGAVFRTPRGGFLLVNGPLGDVYRYFQGRDWERVPFMWREYHIYRRRLGASA